MIIVPPPAPPKFEPLYFAANRPVRTMVRNIPVLFKQCGTTWVYKVENERVSAQISKLARDHTYGIRASTKEEYDTHLTRKPDPIIAPAPEPESTFDTSTLTIRQQLEFIVVIPFARKDAQLALDGVKWMKEMGQVPHYDCLISCDDLVPKCILKMISSAASEVFQSVDVLVYQRPKHTSWPYAPNWAFQKTADYIHKKIGRSWLWKEADMMALTPDWIERLQSEFIDIGKPFMGSIVIGRNHCNGTAVYPPDFPLRCPEAMKCTNVAFDVVMTEDVVPHCHNASHLMQHIWGLSDGKPNPTTGTPIVFENKEQVDQWIDPKAVTIHRVKNSSLIEILRKNRPKKTKDECSYFYSQLQ